VAALRSDLWVLGLCVLYAAAMAPVVPELLSPDNLLNLAAAVPPLLAVTLGQTIVLLTGGIDLSATATVALTSVAGAAIATGQVPGIPAGFAGTLAAVPAMFALGATIGGVNGLAVTRLGMPPFMVTLAVMMFGGGLAVWATGSRSIHGLPESFLEPGRGVLFGILPHALWLVGCVALVVHVFLTRTPYGRWLYAAGWNARTARVSGVPVARVLILAYVLSGLCAALGSLLYTGRLETGSPILGQRIFLDVIGAAVIGGTSLFGGRGSVLGTTLGALFITLVDNSLGLLGVSSFLVLVAKGGIILGAALLDAWRTRGGGRR
jgi:ribose/xylose/arabinose/galactoside ABC-type transport system permease subunit